MDLGPTRGRLEILLARASRAGEEVKIEMDTSKNYFGVLIQHPEMAPDKITRQLGIMPTSSAAAGDMVTTSAGVQTGSRHKWTFWCYYLNFDVEVLENPILDLVKQFSVHREFLHRLTVNGIGHVSFIVRSNEARHIACSFAPSTLLNLSDLSMTIEFEVF
jgi:hypothetical protein